MPANANGIEPEKANHNGRQTFEILLNKLHMSLAFVYHIETFFIRTIFEMHFQTN